MAKDLTEKDHIDKRSYGGKKKRTKHMLDKRGNVKNVIETKRVNKQKSLGHKKL